MIGAHFKQLRKHPFNIQEKKILWILSSSTFLELLDFVIFIYYSDHFSDKLIKMRVPLMSLMTVYAIFAIGYLCKPVGLIIFYKYGYKICYRHLLYLTGFVTFMSFMLMALIPEYKEFSYWAIIILAILRIIQGVSSGCEIVAILSFTNVKFSLVQKQHIYHLIILAAEIGILFGIFLNRGLDFFHFYYYTSVTWRYAFMFSGILAFISLLFRIILNNKNYTHLAVSTYNNFFLEIIRTNYKLILIMVSMLCIQICLNTSCIILMPVYLYESLDLKFLTIGSILFTATIVSIITAYLTSRLAKKVNAITLLKYGYCLVIILAFVSYGFLFKEKYITLGVVLLACSHGFFAQVIYALFRQNSQLTIKLDFIGHYIIVAVSFIIFGGLGPLFVVLCMYLLSNIIIAPAVLLILSAFIGMIGLKYYKRYFYTNK